MQQVRRRRRRRTGAEAAREPGAPRRRRGLRRGLQTAASRCARGGWLGVVARVRRAGCGAGGNERALEYMPDMARGPAYKAFAPNAATRDGLTLQPPVAGTIARGRLPFHYGRGEPEAARAGRELVNPLATRARDDRRRARPLPDVLPGLPRRGRQGGRPAGRGRQDPAPPAYTSERVARVPARADLPCHHDGHGEDAVVRGAADAGRRWKVVAYVSQRLQGASPP